MSTLRKGSTGTAVRELQKLLNLTGAGLTVDGDFGTKTLNAVKAFQKENGLTVDGVVGAKTWAKLKALENPVIGIINDCVKDIQALPSFKKFMELIGND